MNDPDTTPGAVTANGPVVVELSDADELTELFPRQATQQALVRLSENPVEPRETGTLAESDPEFDAYMSVVRLLVGGTVEGVTELTRRLQKLETELRADEAANAPGAVESTGDLARYMLVGMALSMSDGLRRQVMQLVQASDIFWRVTGSATTPLVDNRVTGIIAGPIDRAINRLVNRGQNRINDWVELGRTQEPTARLLARKAYLEIVDDFINHLSENEELAQLVQEQSVGLAAETVDEFRSRTVSADALAEGIVRRILKRPPRLTLPPPPDEIRAAVADDTDKKRAARRS